MFCHSLAGSKVIHGAHPEEVSAFVNRHIGRHSLDLLGSEKRSSSLSFCEFAGFGLSEVSYGNHVRIKSPALEDVYHFQLVTRGECLWRHGDDRLRVRRGQALMVNPDEEIDLEYSADCEKLIVRVPQSVLNAASASANGSAQTDSVHFGRSPVDLRECPALASILEAVFCELREADGDEINPVSLSYREIILKKLLKVFPSNRESRDCATGGSVALDRVVRFIDENLKGTIDIEELSEVSNMSVRSIYNAFSRAYSTTPKCFVKQRKLNKLREDLLRGQCRNITEVALDYGFSHLGRFSSDYRKAFGELPSETLKMAS